MVERRHGIEQDMSMIAREAPVVQKKKCVFSIIEERALLTFPCKKQEAAFKEFYHASLPWTLIRTSLIGFACFVVLGLDCGDLCRTTPESSITLQVGVLSAFVMLVLCMLA
jgi:hypothetical protein